MQEVKLKMPDKQNERKQRYISPKERKQNKLNTIEHCLQEIYHNTKLNIITIEVLHPYCVDKGFSNLLKRQYSEYTYLVDDLLKYCSKQNIQLRTNSSLVKFLLSISTAINMISNKSNAHLAEIIIQELEMGINCIAKVQTLLAEKAATNEFADRLMMLFNQNLEDMKLFL